MPQAAPSKAALEPGNQNDPGPYREGGDVLLDGEDIYVGISGKASDRNGAAWLAGFFGPGYRVHPLVRES
jgi:N-dimethylarginine dimethylaminohydrolase